VPLDKAAANHRYVAAIGFDLAEIEGEITT
jgi:hypothetical protein